jgi:hypothetical protein
VIPIDLEVRLVIDKFSKSVARQGFMIEDEVKRMVEKGTIQSEPL